MQNNRANQLISALNLNHYSGDVSGGLKEREIEKEIIQFWVSAPIGILAGHHKED